MIYIDTSSLLKLVISDDQSLAVEIAVSVEPNIVISILTELEASVQIKGMFLGGKVSKSRMGRIRDDLSLIINNTPFETRKLSGTVFATALIQHEIAKTHCRSLDRLHLAAMEELRISRLMTHDARQAEAARELGYEVISPGL